MSKFYVVIRMEAGNTISPQRFPTKIHDSYESAYKEANRLAVKEAASFVVMESAIRFDAKVVVGVLDYGNSDRPSIQLKSNNQDDVDVVNSGMDFFLAENGAIVPVSDI